MSIIGLESTPIYEIEMPGTAWKLLWWMICMMDEKQEIHMGWRSQAGRDLKRNRLWIATCGKQLIENGLIECGPRKRTVKVLVGNILG